MARFKDKSWELQETPEKKLAVDQCQLAVLMDLRDELKEINRHLVKQDQTTEKAAYWRRKYMTKCKELRGERKKLPPVSV